MKVNYQQHSAHKSLISLAWDTGEQGREITHGGHYYESALLLPGNICLKPWTRDLTDKLRSQGFVILIKSLMIWTARGRFIDSTHKAFS